MLAVKHIPRGIRAEGTDSSALCGIRVQFAHAAVSWARDGGLAYLQHSARSSAFVSRPRGRLCGACQRPPSAGNRPSRQAPGGSRKGARFEQFDAQAALTGPQPSSDWMIFARRTRVASVAMRVRTRVAAGRSEPFAHRMQQLCQDSVLDAGLPGD